MGLEYIYAVWLLHEAKKEINADNIKKVLTSVGIEPNDAMVNAVLASLQGVDLDKIKEESLSFAPVQVSPQQVEQKKEEKQEKKVEEKKEEQALEGLASLFGF
ncbi:MAG: 50S ribosomal protein P1 [Candidatus Nanopusillus sp.]|jgi:large subunit ribosomal protein L12|nr:50S ribosomal protein P1 [Candidatus Nanopusillus sp.]